MITLEQKLDLIMRYTIAEDADEKNRLRDEIRKAISSTELANDIPSVDTTCLLENTIEDLLRELGAPCHLNGYEQVIYAIKMIISDNEYLCKITYRLYPEIAVAFDTTPSRAERNIRHLIESAWSRHDVQDAFRIFGNTIDVRKGKPTNSEFLAACARIVKRRMRDAK